MILSFIRSSALLNDKVLNLIFTLTKKLFFFCSVDLCFFIEGFIPSDILYSMLTAEANLPPTKKTRSALNFYKFARDFKNKVLRRQVYPKKSADIAPTRAYTKYLKINCL